MGVAAWGSFSWVAEVLADASVPVLVVHADEAQRIAINTLPEPLGRGERE
jgi:hypothetical protein